MLHTAPKTLSKTTMQLQPGDVVSAGNCFHGFWSFEIVKVEPSKFNKRIALVTHRFDHGGSETVVYGKNTRWDVIAR